MQELNPNSKNTLISYGLAISAFVALFLVFWNALATTAKICWEVDDYSHGILLPFICIYLIWERKDPLKSLFSKQTLIPFSKTGLVLIIFGLCLMFVGEVSEFHYVQWLAFFPTVIGTLYLVFGANLANIVAGPILLVFMAKPLPDALIPKLFFPLQELSARISANVLEMFDVPVYLMGNIIEIPGLRLLVEEACSGMRSVISLTTVALIVITAISLPVAYKILIVVVAILVAIIMNIVRVAVTGLLAHFYDPKSAEGFFHSFSGMIVFVVSLLIIYQLGKFLTKLHRN
jgi:exosortase